MYSDKLKQCSSTQIILIPVLKNGKPVGNARFAENILQPAAAKQPLAAPGEDQLLLLLGVVLQERCREAEVERREETFQVQDQLDLGAEFFENMILFEALTFSDSWCIFAFS